MGDRKKRRQYGPPNEADLRVTGSQRWHESRDRQMKSHTVSEIYMEERKMRRRRRAVYYLICAISLLVIMLVIWPAPYANAQPAPPDHGTGTNEECATYGCLYGHAPTHYERDGAAGPDPLGIAYERLPDGPDGRYYIRVLWPDGYDPTNRPKWDAVARCESTYRWHYNGSSGFDGGLQFHPRTWTAYGGGEFAPYAWQATPEQQIAVGRRVAYTGHGPHRAQGPGAWPHCGGPLR